MADQQWPVVQGHEYIVTDSKEGDGNELDKHLKDATILISTPFHPACECHTLEALYWVACTACAQQLWSCCSHRAAVRPLQSLIKQG